MIPEDELRSMYQEQEMSMTEIAKEINVHPGTVSRWMNQYEIGLRTPSDRKLVGVCMPTKSELWSMYWVQEMSMQQIAKEVGVSTMAIINRMAQYGIESRTHSEALLINSSKLSKEELEQMYYDQGMSQPEIAKKIGVHFSTVNDWMKKYKIEIRTVSEANRGERSGRWQGGISFEPYCKRFNNTFREAVRERDNCTCQLCGYIQESDGQRLDVHHIHYDKENCYPDVVALCRSCHAKTTSGNRDYWERYFEDLLSERGLLGWSISA